jgi:sialate O-acetylesterase
MKSLFVLPLLLVAAGAFAAEPNAAGQPFLASLFTSHMVLQRAQPVPVWGWTTPGASVVVSLGGVAARGTANADGKWIAWLPAMKAGGPFTLTVTGPQTVTLDDVLLGDVWLCSGQSNMEMGIELVNNHEKEIADANYPQIRLYTVPKVAAPAPLANQDGGPWLVCTPENIQKGAWGGFSAAAYFFGRDLYQKEHVPIGLIHSSWGGTPAEAWTSKSALERGVPEFTPLLAQLAGFAQTGTDDFDARVAAWWTKNDPGTGLDWGNPATSVSGWKTMEMPRRWEELDLPYFDGVVWFRRDFEVPAASAGKEAALSLGRLDDIDETFVNGEKVGETSGATTPRNYTIPAGVLKAGKNTIVIRILDTGGGGGFVDSPAQLHVDVAGAEPVGLAGPWLYKATANLATDPYPIRMAGNGSYPSMLFNGMIAPLVPYAIKGATWYQGESNASRAYQYRALLPTMISDWRARWGEGNFPFLIVQIANYLARAPQPGDNDWAELREAQALTAQKLPNTGLALTIDIGEAGDIHPKNKQEVGRRLALAARHIAYGEKVAYSGPVYRDMSIVGGEARITFDHADGGLVARDGKLPAFEIAGADRKFHWASARIAGDDEVVVSSPDVPAPVAVRYAWAGNPDATLYNKAGLPAVPFRTDDWPGITGPKQ